MYLTNLLEVKQTSTAMRPKQPNLADKLLIASTGSFTQSDRPTLDIDSPSTSGRPTVGVEECRPGPSSSTSSYLVGANPKETQVKPYQATIASAFRKIESFKEGGGLNQKITQAIVYMVCKDCQPFYIVEHIGFNKLMKTLAPHYKVSSRFTIKRLINDKFDVIAAIMRQKLGNKKCTLTTDIWVDPQTRSFLSLTVHSYDEDQDKFIFSGTIGVFMLEERHWGKYR